MTAEKTAQTSKPTDTTKIMVTWPWTKKKINCQVDRLVFKKTQWIARLWHWSCTRRPSYPTF